MDAFELLTTDHRRVSELFEQLEAQPEGTGGAREALFTQLKNELSIHADIEERIFYPALREHAETRELVPEALEEHQTVKEMLAQLEMMPKDTAEWTDTLIELRENVDHHVDEEESEIFEKAREAFGQSRIEELGVRLQKEKQQQQRAAGM